MCPWSPPRFHPARCPYIPPPPLPVCPVPLPPLPLDPPILPPPVPHTPTPLSPLSPSPRTSVPGVPGHVGCSAGGCHKSHHPKPLHFGAPPRWDLWGQQDGDPPAGDSGDKRGLACPWHPPQGQHPTAGGPNHAIWPCLSFPSGLTARPGSGGSFLTAAAGSCCQEGGGNGGGSESARCDRGFPRGPAATPAVLYPESGFRAGFGRPQLPGTPGQGLSLRETPKPFPGGGSSTGLHTSTTHTHSTARCPPCPQPHGDPPGPFSHRSRAGGSVSATGKPQPRAASSRFLAQETLLPGGPGGQESPAGIPACPQSPEQYLFPPLATRISTLPTPLLPLGDPFPFWGAHGIESPASPAAPMSPTSRSARVSAPVLTPPGTSRDVNVDRNTLLLLCWGVWGCVGASTGPPGAG